MAKFNVGDRCEFNGVKGVIKRVKEGKGGFLTGYVFKGDDGEMYEPAEPQLKRISNSTSTNPVVQNALAATARNDVVKENEIEDKLKNLTKVMSEINELYGRARVKDIAVKNEIARMERGAGKMSDDDRMRLGKMAREIRNASPFGSL